MSREVSQITVTDGDTRVVVTVHPDVLTGGRRWWVGSLDGTSNGYDFYDEEAALAAAETFAAKMEQARLAKLAAAALETEAVADLEALYAAHRTTRAAPESLPPT